MKESDLKKSQYTPNDHCMGMGPLVKSRLKRPLA